jgi:hypothetical protein
MVGGKKVFQFIKATRRLCRCVERREGKKKVKRGKKECAPSSTRPKFFQVLEPEESKGRNVEPKKKPSWLVGYDPYRNHSEKKKEIRKYSIRCGSHFNSHSQPDAGPTPSEGRWPLFQQPKWWYRHVP